jgi:hypothetical protein
VSRIERSFAAEADGGELVDAERVDTAALAEALAHGDPAAVTGLGVMSVTAPYERWCVVSELAERLGQIHCLLLLPPVRVRLARLSPRSSTGASSRWASYATSVQPNAKAA